ncbi:TM2 domain-containing protein [Carnobacterium gallinarum]|uniref:TM2 domain-containing protein n=1 Tax=Carnobacterium gallinarum TaxID=2749 RepID=UPI000557066B|nr:TM2 domain-containing protein [Carnobacterium gallinarum]
MAKIIKIDAENGIITIGEKDSSVMEVSIESLEFEPRMGQFVEVFKTETDIIVHPAEEQNTQTNQSGEGININIVNDNNNASNGLVYASGKIVNKVVYIVLALLLGSIGAHKFYSGKILAGIIYILFSWTVIPALLGLIEGIIAAFKTPDSNGNIVV